MFTKKKLDPKKYRPYDDDDINDIHEEIEAMHAGLAPAFTAPTYYPSTDERDEREHSDLLIKQILHIITVRLSLQHRMIFLMYTIEDSNYKQIAERLKINRTRLRRTMHDIFIFIADEFGLDREKMMERIKFKRFK